MNSAFEKKKPIQYAYYTNIFFSFTRFDFFRKHFFSGFSFCVVFNVKRKEKKMDSRGDRFFSTAEWKLKMGGNSQSSGSEGGGQIVSELLLKNIFQDSRNGEEEKYIWKEEKKSSIPRSKYEKSYTWQLFFILFTCNTADTERNGLPKSIRGRYTHVRSYNVIDATELVHTLRNSQSKLQKKRDKFLLSGIEYTTPTFQFL